MADIDYATAPIARDAYAGNPSDGDMPFEIAGFLGGPEVPEVHPETLPTPTDVIAPNVIEGAVVPSVNWPLWIALGVILWIIFSKD